MLKRLDVGNFNHRNFTDTIAPLLAIGSQSGGKCCIRYYPEKKQRIAAYQMSVIMKVDSSVYSIDPSNSLFIEIYQIC